MDVKLGSMHTHHQGAWCKLKCALGLHKHNGKKAASALAHDAASSPVGKPSADRMIYTKTGGSEPSTPTTHRPSLSITMMPRSAPSSLHGSREDARSSTTSLEQRHAAATDTYRRRSEGDDGYNQQLTLTRARGSLVSAMGASDDGARTQLFDQAITYAEYSASLGSRDAVKFLASAWENGIKLSDGTNGRENAEQHGFWKNVGENLSKTNMESMKNLTYFKLGRHTEARHVTAANFIAVTDYLRSGNDVSISDAQSKLGQLKGIVAGQLKELPSMLLHELREQLK